MFEVNVFAVISKNQGYYNATKMTVNLLTDQLRIELSPFGVTHQRY